MIPRVSNGKSDGDAILAECAPGFARDSCEIEVFSESANPSPGFAALVLASNSYRSSVTCCPVSGGDDLS